MFHQNHQQVQGSRGQRDGLVVAEQALLGTIQAEWPELIDLRLDTRHGCRSFGDLLGFFKDADSGRR
jgi:hypothetical protein